MDFTKASLNNLAGKYINEPIQPRKDRYIVAVVKGKAIIRYPPATCLTSIVSHVCCNKERASPRYSYCMVQGVTIRFCMSVYIIISY